MAPRSRPLNRLALLIVVVVALAPTAARAREYVNSFEDFITHTRSHILRTEKLGLELFEHYRARFADVPPDLLRDFLRLHDRTKVDPSLLKDRPRPIARDLYDMGYGKGVGKGQLHENPDFMKVVNELNTSDHRVALDFFRNHELLDAAGEPLPVAREMLLIEKVADQVDRSLSPVSAEEFHKVMEPATVWMKRPEEKELAAYLVQPGLYRRVTAGATYEDLRAALKLRGACSQEALGILRLLKL